MIRISEDFIFGMTFLTNDGCTINFRQLHLILDGRVLSCTGRHGRIFTSRVQALQAAQVAHANNVTLHCRMKHSQFALFGVIEGAVDPLMIAASVNQPTPESIEIGPVIIVGPNLTDQLVEPSAGAIIQEYTSIK